MNIKKSEDLYLYSAPMNLFSNYLFRHLLLKKGCDYVFTEMIRFDRFEEELNRKKLNVLEGDESRTIFQLALSRPSQIPKAIENIIKLNIKPFEINLNMGCPNSTMQQNQICGGILYDKILLKDLCSKLKQTCSDKNIIPSVKLRLGTKPENIEIYEYLKIIHNSGIKKVYIHARPLFYSYTKPALYSELKDLNSFIDDYGFNIILNGDIDSYPKYNQTISNFNCSGIMIGRASLINPLIFKQIKNKDSHDIGHFDPVQNDFSLIKEKDVFVLSKEKLDFIKDFLDLAISHKENISFIRNNLVYFFKGLSNRKDLKQILNSNLTLIELKSLLLNKI
jgi:tRNA-dihydrouridine synthase B